MLVCRKLRIIYRINFRRRTWVWTKKRGVASVIYQFVLFPAWWLFSGTKKDVEFLESYITKNEKHW